MAKKICFLAGLMLPHTLGVDNETLRWRRDAIDYFNEFTSCFKLEAPEEYTVPTELNDMSAKESLRFDMRKVREANVILVNLKDIDKSISACDEIFYGFLENKPVIGFLENGEPRDIPSWKLEQIDRVFYGKKAMKNAINYIAIHYA